ncbi:unnamed protein product [Lota lota]
MAGYQRCISLALVCLWLCHHSLAVPLNSEPCKPNNNAYNAHDAFLMKHVPAATPRTLGVTEGKKNLKKKVNFKRSFLNHNDLEEVLQVCSDEGGLRYTTNQKPGKKTKMTNLCISTKPFNYVTVHYNQSNENPYTIVDEHKHLILACDKVGNQCLPVHFEPNDDKKTVTGPLCLGLVEFTYAKR